VLSGYVPGKRQAIPTAAMGSRPWSGIASPMLTQIMQCICGMDKEVHPYISEYASDRKFESGRTTLGVLVQQKVFELKYIGRLP
jgi:hypothetical protein